MIEVTLEGCRPDGSQGMNYTWEAGVSDVIFLPDWSLVSERANYVRITGKCLGSYFGGLPSYSILKSHVRIVPELPLNQVIGIPSLEGKIFGEQE